MNGQNGYALTPLVCEFRHRLGAHAPSYRTLYNKVLDGRLHTVKVSGQHFVPGTLDEIAAQLGIDLHAFEQATA